MTNNNLKNLLNKSNDCLDYFNINLDFAIDFIYNSLLFENNKTKKEEVEAIMLSKVTPNTKTDIAIRNHFAALVFTLELVKNNTEIDENKIKDIHELLLFDLGIGGLYRNVDISVRGSSHIPPNYMKVYDRMKKYINTINTPDNDVYKLIAYSHLQLAKIHPFLDGNGRCSRLVLLLFSLKNNLNPFFIPYSDKDIYFSYVEEFKVNKNIEPFINYLKQL